MVKNVCRVYHSAERSGDILRSLSVRTVVANSKPFSAMLAMVGGLEPPTS
ncbi:hypothetical protein H9M60_004169 [Salmonella enterica]|nr:hypothetical protein [Salmonella enterica]